MTSVMTSQLFRFEGTVVTVMVTMSAVPVVLFSVVVVAQVVGAVLSVDGVGRVEVNVFRHEHRKDWRHGATCDVEAEAQYELQQEEKEKPEMLCCILVLRLVENSLKSSNFLPLRRTSCDTK